MNQNHLTIDKYSHHFVVTRMSLTARRLIQEYCRDLQDWVLVKKQGRFRKEPGKIYAASNKRRTYFRFHINHLEGFSAFIRNSGIRDQYIVTNQRRPPKGAEATFKIPEIWKPRDYQVPKIEYLVDGSSRTKILTLQTGKGKMQPLDAKIKVPGGWSTMGDMTVGTIVTAQDGTPTEVTGVYPNGLRNIYRVTMEDGRSTEAGSKHLWSVYNKEWESDKDTDTPGWRVINTIQLGAGILKDTGTDYLIPRVRSEEIPDVPLLMCPWVLGRWLTGQCEALGQMNLVEGMRILELYGLIGAPHDELFIPEQYLNGSHAQRVKLLRGIMEDRTEVELYSSTICKQVLLLARSLGHTATMSMGPESTVVTVDYSKEVGLKVAKVEFIGVKEAQCISIKHQSRLYVTDDYIVTHNTFCALKACEHIGLRTLLVVPAKYMDKWKDDVEEAYGIRPGKLLTVKGEKGVNKLIKSAQDGELEAEFIIVSSTTMLNYIKAYEAGKKKYLCSPLDFTKVCGVGVKVVDEAHEQFWGNFKQDLYLNVSLGIYLSATLTSPSKLVTNMYQVMFPTAIRTDELAYDRYVAVKAMHYSISGNPNRIRSTGGQGTYSHIAFEQWIRGKSSLSDGYVNMVMDMMEREFLKVFEPGRKCLIYCASIEMCELVKKYIEAKYPKLRVTTKVAKDDFEVLEQNDVIVSTLLSTGTAVDISGLTHVIMTTSIQSMIANLQAIGRLRRLKQWPDFTPIFMYLVCKDIPKQIEYHKAKVDLFNGRALTQAVEYVPTKF